MTLTIWTTSPPARSVSTPTRRSASASSTTLCAETLAGIADPLFPSLDGAARVAPAEAARSVLSALVDPLETGNGTPPLPPWLLPHQADAVARAQAILDRFGGVLVADGVGLGKTFIGLALAALARHRGHETLVLAPAALRREWEVAAREVGEPMRFVSHTALATRPLAIDGATRLLVVDEAHAFRNPRTRRYDALARLATGRRVVLLTATPVNNTPLDLAALIHLFAGTGSFRRFGIPDLFTALRRPDSPWAALALAAVTVSRSRRLVQERFPDLRDAFPRRLLLPAVRYDLRAAFGGRLDDILGPLTEAADLADEERGAALLILGLLRRLESSRTALLQSLRRHDTYLHAWHDAQRAGRLLTRRDMGHRDGDADGAQLALWSLLLDHAADARSTAHRWTDLIRRALAASRAAIEGPDPKTDALVRLLDGPLSGRKTIVFTEYRDTALALAAALRHRRRLLCVAGDAAWAGSQRLSRREALDAFAPVARGARRSPLLDADLLIATDVASEGMNLQDASAVVNYDLPWNPVRVMQRVGRIDRLRSPHATIAVAHVVADAGLADLAGVLGALRRKLERVVGTAAEPDPLSALWWLDADRPMPDAIEHESWRRVEPFEARERWRAAAGPGPTRRRPVVAAGLVRDGLGAAAGVLLAIEWPDGTRLPLPFVLETGGGVRCEAHALGALAERALTSLPMVASPSDFRTALATVLPSARSQLLACSAARHGAPAVGPGRRRALHRLAQAAKAAASRRDAGTLDRVSEAMARLTDEVPAGFDRALADACAAVHGEASLASIEAIIRRATPAPVFVPAGAPRLVFLAAMALAEGCPAEEAVRAA